MDCRKLGNKNRIYVNIFFQYEFIKKIKKQDIYFSHFTYIS